MGEPNLEKQNKAVIDQEGERGNELEEMFTRKIRDFNSQDKAGLRILLQTLVSQGWGNDSLKNALEEVVNAEADKKDGGPMSIRMDLVGNEQDKRVEKYYFLTSDENGVMGELTVAKALELLEK